MGWCDTFQPKSKMYLLKTWMFSYKRILTNSVLETKMVGFRKLFLSKLLF